MNANVEQTQPLLPPLVPVPVPVPAPAPADIVYRGIAFRDDDADLNLIDNYIISILNVEDDELKVSIALELFTWLDDCYPLRQVLLKPENDDLLEDFVWLLEEMASIPAYAAALAANHDDDLTDSEIKNFVCCWRAVLKERERQLAEEFAAIAANYCHRCDEALEAEDIEALEAENIAYANPYCHHCTLAKIDEEFTSKKHF